MLSRVLDSHIRLGSVRKLQGLESMDDLLPSMDDISSECDVDFDAISPSVSRDFVFAVEEQFTMVDSVSPPKHRR